MKNLEANSQLSANSVTADQYTEMLPQVKVKKNGEKCITDRELTIQYIYNIFYWTGNIAGLGALATTVLERYVGFWAAFVLPLVGIGTSCTVMTIFGQRFGQSIHAIYFQPGLIRAPDLFSTLS